MDGWMEGDVNIDIPVLKHSSSEYNQCVSLLSQTDRKSVGFFTTYNISTIYMYMGGLLGRGRVKIIDMLSIELQYIMSRL